MFRALACGAAFALAAVAAQAQPETAQRTAVCVDVNGALKSANCRAQASRLEARQDICSCAQGVRVQADICPPGVSPPGESLAVAKARNQFLREHTDLVGATFEGRPLCVAPRQR